MNTKFAQDELKLSAVKADELRLERALTAGRSTFLGFLVKRLGNRADAEDVLQDFCLRALRHGDQLGDVARMDAWLYAILRSALNDHYRKKGRSRRLADAWELEHQTAEQCEESAEAMRTICKCVVDLIPELRPQDALLIKRIDIDEVEHAKVAADLGVRPGTLNVRQHRARAALRNILIKHCGCCCAHGFDDCSCGIRPDAADRDHVRTADKTIAPHARVARH